MHQLWPFCLLIIVKHIAKSENLLIRSRSAEIRTCDDRPASNISSLRPDGACCAVVALIYHQHIVIAKSHQLCSRSLHGVPHMTVEALEGH